MTITKATLNETLANLAETFEQIDKLSNSINDELDNDGFRSMYRSAQQQEYHIVWLESKQEELEDEVESAVKGVQTISHFFEELSIITVDEWKQLDAVFTAIVSRLEAKL